MSKFMSPSEVVRELVSSLRGVYLERWDEIIVQRQSMATDYIDGRRRYHATLNITCSKDKPYQQARATVDLIVRQDKEVTVFVSSPSYNQEIVFQSEPDSATYWLTDVEILIKQEYNNDKIDK